MITKLDELRLKIIKNRHQSQNWKNILFLIKEYWNDSIYLLKKFGVRRWYNFWYTKFFISDEGGEFNLNAKRYKRKPLSLEKPVKIEVEHTTVCNKRCILCSHTHWNYKQQQMPFEKFKKLIDDIPSLRWINLAGIGSNFLNKDFIKIVEYASQKQLNVNFVDEFEFFTEEQARKIIELGVNSIYISFDASKKETYEKMKEGCNYDIALSNIKTLLRLKEEMKSPFPVLHFRFIINKLNYTEMAEYVDLVNSLKPRGTRARMEFIGLIRFPEIEDQYIPVEELPDDLILRVYEKALAYDINLYFSHASAVSPRITDCIRWCEPFVLVSGEVIPCCSILLQSQRDFLQKYSFGNVFEENFYNIWNSEKYKKFRKQVVKGNQPVPMICKDCCSHTNTERVKRYGYSE